MKFINKNVEKNLSKIFYRHFFCTDFFSKNLPKRIQIRVSTKSERTSIFCQHIFEWKKVPQKLKIKDLLHEKLKRNRKIIVSKFLHCFSSHEDCVKISRPCLSYFARNKPSNSDMVGLGQFIVLNDSASPKMVIKLYFNFSKGFRAVWMSSRRPIYSCQ